MLGWEMRGLGGERGEGMGVCAGREPGGGRNVYKRGWIDGLLG